MNKLLYDYLVHIEHYLAYSEVLGYYSEILDGVLIYNINLSNSFLNIGQETVSISNDDILIFLYDRSLLWVNTKIF